jgi:hypothetical protein
VRYVDATSVRSRPDVREAGRERRDR